MSIAPALTFERDTITRESEFSFCAALSVALVRRPGPLFNYRHRAAGRAARADGENKYENLDDTRTATRDR